MTEQLATDAPPAENPVVPFPSPRKRVGVMIATPLKHFDGTAEDLDRQVPQIGRALRELVARKAEHNFDFEFAAACGGLCSARNRLVHEFMKTDGTWFVPWDADLYAEHGLEADALLRILSHGEPVIGALYCKRERDASRPRYVANWLSGAVIQKGGLLQVVELGGGGMKAYNRCVFAELKRIFGDEPLAKKKPTINYRERETGEWIAAFYQIANVEQDLLSEDFFLDYLCRCAGIGIIADTVVRLRQVDEPSSEAKADYRHRVAAFFRENAQATMLPQDFQLPQPTLYPTLDQPWPPIPAEDESQ